MGFVRYGTVLVPRHSSTTFKCLGPKVFIATAIDVLCLNLPARVRLLFSYNIRSIKTITYILQIEHTCLGLPSNSTHAGFTESTAHAQVLRRLTKRKIFLLIFLATDLTTESAKTLVIFAKRSRT